jgi:5-methylcytosine-specific restriction endonuclease McrA
MVAPVNLEQLSNDLLISDLKHHLGDERHSLAQFIAHLAEMDRRRCYEDLGYSSLFRYCLEELQFAEGAAYRRIRAARLARNYPQIIGMIAAGEVHLEALALVHPLITDANAEELLAVIRFKTKRDVEQIVRMHDPRPDVPDSMRRVHAKRVAGPPPTVAGNSENGSLQLSYCDERKEVSDFYSTSSDSKKSGSEAVFSPDSAKPLSADRVKIQFTGSVKLQEKIRQAQELLRHTYPEGKLEDIFEAAIDLLIQSKTPSSKKVNGKKSTSRRVSASSKKNPQSRRIPRPIRAEVWKRDRGCCQFVGTNGRQCAERGMLEFDHIQPFSCGGSSTDPSNIRLLCRTHNQARHRHLFRKSIECRRQ